MLHPWVPSSLALFLGVAFALAFGNPYAAQVKGNTHRLLAIAIIGLGAGMNIAVIGAVGLQGIGYTVLGIGFTFLVGAVLGKILTVPKNISLLLTMGTSICGGSAIAATAPVIRAKHQEVSVALGTVFMLNAIALLIFPWIGHEFSLTERQFGLWAGLSIHDTSSVVGASLSYGPHALEVGTTVKLARALWIVPLVLLIGFVRSKTEAREPGEAKAKRPWFILGFLIAAAIVTWIPALQPAGHVVETLAKRLMVLTLFLIGSNLTLDTLKSVGLRPLVQGVALWAITASGTLAAIYYGLIR